MAVWGIYKGLSGPDGVCANQPLMIDSSPSFSYKANYHFVELAVEWHSSSQIEKTSQNPWS